MVFQPSFRRPDAGGLRRLPLVLFVALLGWTAACSRVSQESDGRAPEGAPPPAAEESAALPAADGPELARFVVQARDAEQAARLGEELVARYGGEASARPLFEAVDPADDPDGMARMFRVAIPASGLGSANPWENAYALEAELALAQAEPDLEATHDPALETAQICLSDDAPPEDPRWSLESIRAVEAWQLEPPPGGKRFGEGVVVCHPDTGWSEHVDLDAARLDLAHARNLLGNGTPDGRDPLDYEGVLLHPGHGTGTGSVIVSGHEAGRVFGVAPGARLVPIRTAMSVVQVFDSDLARAIDHAAAAGCDVVSMSLGGRAFFGLEAAIRRAVRRGTIVAAAAGNCVRFVVAPAAYRDTLAIGGSNVHDGTWRGSSRGPAVDVSAPAEHVWVASRHKASDPTDAARPGEGTSYAVANVAGAAALWLAFHGPDALAARYGDVPLQEVFRALAQRTARVPAGWDAGRYGAGILDVEALLRAPLPSPAAILPLVPERGEGELEILAAITGRTPGELAPLLAELFGVATLDVEDRLRVVGPELEQLALTDPVGFERLLGRLAGEEGTGGANALAGASATLRDALDPALAPASGGGAP
ncbi:MAG TPA: S8/S53 family peptidase [Thermoanaerobaculia bacterium]|nr:S8/S53 family peptidase [Thermoanaerobaculia bacterium]